MILNINGNSQNEAGNLGDEKSVGKGANEQRIFYGLGYRNYFGLDSNIGSTHGPLLFRLTRLVAVKQFQGNFNKISWWQDLLLLES